MQQDTICAIATAPGNGGIAIIRISGADALEYTLPYLYKGGVKISSLPNRQAVFCRFIGDDEQMIDEVVTTAYHAPNSYTGEDVVELSCHGSTYIMQTILKYLFAAGCRLAEPGEFTQRAYLNGKMDLSQAEAVADLIAGESEAQHRMAINQMRGGYSSELNGLREKLLYFVSLIELELDFSEEDVTFANREQLQTLLNELITRISSLERSFQLGNAIKKGVPVAIVGPTNAGKSTLLNRLLGEEKAIVSNIHGTTRDVIEDTMIIDGMLFRFIDTAGLRKTEDEIETIGIERSYKKLNKADIVLLMLSATDIVASDSYKELYADVLNHIQSSQKLIIVLNKSDLLDTQALLDIEKRIKEICGERTSAVIKISASTNQNIEQLKALIAESHKLTKYKQGDMVVSNIRHYTLLQQVHEALNRVNGGLDNDLPGDLLSQDIREAITYLGEITGGQITSDSVLHNIFRHFCIGK